MLRTVKRIVVGTDLSETTGYLIPEAALVARTFGAELFLVHAIPEAREHSPQFDAVAGEAEALLRELREAQGREGVRVSAADRISSGDIADLVLSTAQDVQAELIMIGAGKRSTLDRLLLGTSAERVLREADRPVWVTRPHNKAVGVKRILCAVDESAPAREALATAAFLARTLVADLTLLTVTGTGRHKVGDSLANEIDLHGIETARILREGSAPDRIVEVAEETGADLLILGSAGRTGLKRLVLGKNTAEKLSRVLPCSLLAVPEDRQGANKSKS